MSALWSRVYREVEMKFWIILSVFFLIVITGSFISKVKGALWITVYIVIYTAMIWIRPHISSTIVSAVDSLLFILLLFWLAIVNKDSVKRIIK